VLLASEVVRGKTPKTFQNLSFPFIASQVGENGVRGDPKKSGHPPVNADFGPYIHAACSHLSRRLQLCLVLPISPAAKARFRS